MIILLKLIIVVLCVTFIPSSAQAAKFFKSSKERLVLMPLRVGDADKSRIAAMETALVEGLQQKYEVYSGEQVVNKTREIFIKESRVANKKECDEIRCMQDIAEAFQAEIIAICSVSKQENGYLLTLNLHNIFDTKVIYSKSLPCKNCDAYQMVEKLKELNGVSEINANSSFISSNDDAEKAIWIEAQKGNTLEDYLIYLTSYPKGKYIAFAKLQIDKFELEKVRKLQLPEMVAIPGKNFQIGKFEVTQIEWRAVMGMNPLLLYNCDDTCPVINVSWNDVQEYILKINTMTGKQYRLPSSEEWEYSCYGGNKTEYCGGNDVDAVAWYKDNSNNTSHPVGLKQANGYGLYDMSGNVGEWQSDQYYAYDNMRGVRGGSYGHWANSQRVIVRDSKEIDGRFSTIGFRLARTLP